MKQKVLLISLIMLGIGFGFSQEKGKVGFLFKSGSMNSVGLSFNLSDCLVLRPSFGFSTAKTDIESPTTSPAVITEKTRAYSADLGIFYHFVKKDSLSVYSGLEGGYSYGKRDKGVPGLLWYKTEAFIVTAVLGLQYNLNKHLAVFGEVGMGFLKGKEKSNSTTYYGGLIISDTTSWGLQRTGFGIILYI